MKRFSYAVLLLMLSCLFFWKVQNANLKKINHSIELIHNQLNKPVYQECSPYFIDQALLRTSNTFKIDILYAPLNSHIPESDLFHMPLSCVKLFYHVISETHTVPFILGKRTRSTALHYEELVKQYFQLLEETQYFLAQHGGIKTISPIILTSYPSFFENNVKYQLHQSYIDPEIGINIYENPEHIQREIKSIKALIKEASHLKTLFRKQGQDIIGQFFLNYEMIFNAHSNILNFVKDNRSVLNFYFLSWIYRINKKDGVAQAVFQYYIKDKN